MLLIANKCFEQFMNISSLEATKADDKQVENEGHFFHTNIWGYFFLSVAVFLMNLYV